MKAVTWQGKRDVQVTEVPDPRIEEPTDAIVRITSTGICGSDLHLYEVLGPFIDPGDVLGHEPMGVVEEVGSEVDQIAPGDRVVIPFNISCGRCFMCDHGLQSQCETTQNRDQGTGASLLGYTKLYGQVPGGQAEFLRVPQAHYGPIKVPEGPDDDRFVYLSDVLPTAWQAVEYADIPDGGSVAVFGLGPIGEMSTRVAQHRGAGQVIGLDLVPERIARARAHGVEVLDVTELDDVAEAIRELTGGRGPDSVIDAVGMEAHGAPGAKLAQKVVGLLPDAVAQKLMETAARRSDVRPLRGDRVVPPRRHDLALGRLRRRHGPAADAPDLRQAAQPADGPGERPALDRRHPAAPERRRRPARRGRLRDPSPTARGRAARLRDLPEEAGQRLQDPAEAVSRHSREVATITPYRDGPLLVRGPVRLVDMDGGEIEVGRETIALCRCGKSRIRPFCDGTHKLTRFRAESGPEDRTRGG